MSQTEDQRMAPPPSGDAKPPLPAGPGAQDHAINALIEHVFGITVLRRPNGTVPLISMDEVAPLCIHAGLIDLECLDQALFERLLLNQPAEYLCGVAAGEQGDEAIAAVCERRVFSYLHAAFVRNARRCGAGGRAACAPEVHQRVEELVMRNILTAVKEPDLYEGQAYADQLLEIFRDADVDEEMTARFLNRLGVAVGQGGSEGAEQNLAAVMGGVFHEMRRVAKQSSLGTLQRWVMPTLQMLVGDKTQSVYANALVQYNSVLPVGHEQRAQMLSRGLIGADGQPTGAAFMETLFGELLRLSILPKLQNARAEYFQGMTSASLAPNEHLWTALRHHLDDIHALFHALLLHAGSVRATLLTWIGDCLHHNAARGQIWNSHNLFTGATATASDAFMLNLAGVMLRLSRPLMRPAMRVLLVDPTYCSVPAADCAARSVHLRDLAKETCLIPPPQTAAEAAQSADSPAPKPTGCTDTYNFITEVFFATHRALDLSYRVCFEQFFKLNRELQRIQQAYQAELADGGAASGQPPGTSTAYMDIYNEQVPRMLCLQNVLLEPHNDQLQLQFYEATSNWLVQLAARDIPAHQQRGFAPITAEPVRLPLAADRVPPLLSTVPEMIVENCIGYLTFVRHFERQAIDTDLEAQQALFTALLVFMGDAGRVRNPHMRARMAEGLESLLPNDRYRASRGGGGGGGGSFSTDYYVQLFTQHPHRLQVVEALLSVFVGIEMTGQSVQFEQKFNYRRPMYLIMDYLWTIPEQMQCFRQLAEAALLHMDDVNPPIFLRFVNLLINDAIFLLDESLSNLKQIRELQLAQDAGKWEALPQQERQQQVANLQHLGTMARFDNLMGQDTLRVLKMLTSEIDGIFGHRSMRDRVAAMLNYFLLHLVGPKKGTFSVKDKKEFEFDPAKTVREICQIYLNLETHEGFVLAVSQDGRSYSAQLFEYAEQVLVRIGGGELIERLSAFAAKVRRMEQLERVNQEALADAPDEFLDPIMSTLMLDPVLLPSSNVTVDRTTIARHLLSDQSDPFNRAPLTMDQVQPDVELANKITAWIAEKRAAAALEAEAKVAEGSPPATAAGSEESVAAKSNQ